MIFTINPSNRALIQEIKMMFAIQICGLFVGVKTITEPLVDKQKPSIAQLLARHINV